MTCLLKRRSAFSTVSPSWSLTSAKRHLYPVPVFPLLSNGLFRGRRGLFRRRSSLDLRQLFRQFLAGIEARIPFCRDGDGLPGTRVAALALLPVLHHEAAKLQCVGVLHHWLFLL